MQSHSGSGSGTPALKFMFKLKRIAGEVPRASSDLDNVAADKPPETSCNVSSPRKESNPSREKDDDEDTSDGDCSKQLVVYTPGVDSRGPNEPDPDTMTSRPPAFSNPNQPPTVLPSVGAFTVQCAGCFKWRLIPTKKKYEEIREHILEDPFYCETAREWRPCISCDDPEDISPDGSRLWAIDKPNIAQPPPGWQRLLRIRGEGGSKFADVYYVAPSGKRLRSMVEIQKYLEKHPEYRTDEMSLSRFSFQIPRPLHDSYVRKRPRAAVEEAKALTWAGPDNSTQLHLGPPGLPSCHAEAEAAVIDDGATPAKKRLRKNLLRQTFSCDSMDVQQDASLLEPCQYTMNNSNGF
ncbi:hypothetical protein MLD38_014870 [Melastoma candidum]|uniref:Uncharacterized protein n=1 Tax=Melastoma candidum TaxID=119954 RepID=A0ACB9RG20_9MYRT|nr:hypothetical protein MLD38_014870 [Melastoma candidum]